MSGGIRPAAELSVSRPLVGRRESCKLTQISEHESRSSSEGPTSVPAVWSLVLGVLSVPPFPFGPLTGIPAILCGRKAIRTIQAAPQPHRRTVLARAGIVLGYIGIFITIGLVFLILAGVVRP